MNPDWKVGKAKYAEFNVPTCGKVAVWQLCRERQPLWNSHDSWWPELKMFWINAMVFVPMAEAPTKAGAKDLSYDSLNLIHEFTSLFRRRWFMQVCLGRPSHGSMPLWKPVFFRWLGKQRPRFARGLPKGNFQLKELHRTTKAYSHMNADWNWRRPNVLSSIRQHVARLQFDSCAKKDSLCVTVMIYDGLNLRCLDQCHRVRSHGKSSSQSWRKRIVIQQSEFSL